MTDVREPLNAALVAAALTPPWSRVEVVAESASTNAELASRAATLPAGYVLACEHQTAGHGRLGRSWVAPAKAGLTFSALLRPDVPREQWGWIPLLVGVALCETVRGTGVAAALKWPNDLLVGLDEFKAAGVLVEVAADGSVVLGVGLNVTTAAAELPIPQATSLLLAGAAVLDRTHLLIDLLNSIGHWYERWLGAGGDAQVCGLAAEYERVCASIGREVTVARVGAESDPHQGVVTGVDPAGRLRLRLSNEIAENRSAGDLALRSLGGGEVLIDAGDVVHVRAVEETGT